jgi:hypothetical protein
MAHETREALLVPLSVADTEQSLDAVLAERGFERAQLPPPQRGAPPARSDERFFDVELLQPTLSLVREWNGYSDATSWGAALELAEGLPSAARMEMALPPALSVLARALSRRATVLGVAARAKPGHLVGVAFRDGRAVDVITVVKDRIAIGPRGEPKASTPQEAKAHLLEWLAPYGVSAEAVNILLGERDLPATWRLAYLHA